MTFFFKSLKLNTNGFLSSKVIIICLFLISYIVGRSFSFSILQTTFQSSGVIKIYSFPLNSIFSK